MIVEQTAIAGVFVVAPQRRADDRGWFARTYCADEFRAAGLNTHWPQCNASFNQRRGTLRGLHWQAAPHGEVKLVRCTRGAAFDVAVDIRPMSPTFGQWVGVEITEENGCALYIDAGLAHGFQTLVDETELFYQMGAVYVPEAGRGVRFDDPAIGIDWPVDNEFSSEADRKLPSLAELTSVSSHG